MTSPLKSLMDCGTKIWLDSIDPDLVALNRKLGATGATSNPIIVADLIKTGRFNDQITDLLETHDDETAAWQITDQLVRQAQTVFEEIWKETQGNDGYVSFELDPLLEDTEQGPPHDERVARYIELGKKWSAGHTNRMIKVPATPAGLEAVEELAAAGITLNVTLIFSQRQYEAARDAVWRGAQRRADGLDSFKSVYSIFVSRVDVYTEKQIPTLSADAQGMAGIVNAKQIWKLNQDFWADKGLKLQQEMIFASTGTKKPEDPADKYVAAFAGSDIETNPPKTNDLVEQLGKTYTRQVDQLPPQAVLDELAEKVDATAMEETLMQEGLAKFADPQKALIELFRETRRSLSVTGS